MHKRLIRYAVSLMLVSVMVCMTACGQDDIAPLNKMDEQEQTVDEESSTEEETEEVTEASSEASEEAENAAEQTTEEVNATSAALTAEECKAEIELLKGTEVVLPAETELLAEMARCVTFSRVMDEQGVIFSEMDIYKKSALRTQIIKDIMWGETAFSGAIPVEDAEGRFDADKLIPLEDATAFFKDVYGEDNFTLAEYERIEDGYMLISYGDGEAWEIIEDMQFYEDDNYFLLTGPVYYESNGEDKSLKGTADILFAKNPDSRYGVTLLYGIYY